MHRNVIFTFSLIVYALVATIGLYAFDVGMLTAAIVLLGLPAYLLARFSAAPPVLLITIASFGAGIALLLEGLAFAYGLWHVEAGVGFMLGGGISAEMVAITLIKVFFMVLLYELLFDDGFYSDSNGRTRFEEFSLFAVGAAVIVAIYAFFFHKLLAPSAYYWITVALLTASVAMLFVKRTLTQRFLSKFSIYVAVAAVPLLCFELLAVASGFKVVDTLLHPISVAFFDVSLPAAEILLAFSLPAFVASIYEVYLDDAV